MQATSGRMLIPAGSAPARADRWADRPLRPVPQPRPAAHLRGPADGRRAGREVEHGRRGRQRSWSCASRRRRRAEPIAQPEIPVDVVYEDDDLLIVDKPAGLVVHPAPGHAGGTLVNALLGRGETLGGIAGGIAGVQRPGIVHRLDRDTSGLLMVARSDAAQASLQAQLKARRVKKTYLALVAGRRVGRGRADRGADRARSRPADPHGGRSRTGAPATTGYRVRERFAGWTLLELDLVTGRTHQIRVHLEAIGHPVAGDPLYGTGTSRRGPDGLERLFLHAWRLELTSPSSGRLIRAEAPLPAELDAVLDGLRASGPERPGPR